MRLERRHGLAGVTLVLALASCELEPEQLEPFPEVLLVVDTDALVPQLFDRVQVDLYTVPSAPDEVPVWFFSDTTLRGAPETWPMSFAVVRERLEEDQEVLVRVRLYPDGKVRDNRGERFFPAETLSRFVDTCPTFLDVDAVVDGFLRESGDPDDEGVLPPYEPLPNLTIDRLVRVPMTRGAQGRIEVTLRGACAGVQADLVGLASCVDDGDRVKHATEVIAPTATRPTAPSTIVATYPPPRPCEVPASPTTTLPFDEVVCVDGGAFLLGDPAVFGFDDFDGFPERVAHIPPLAVDRFEVSVGRFRRALTEGRLAGVELPLPNEDELATTSLAPAERHCTFSAEPRGREEHPLNCVSFETARAFCQAEGGDLPTEAQWEHLAAAAGRPSQNRYPWGSTEPTCDRAVFARLDDVTSDASACLDLGYGVQPLRAEAPPDGDGDPVGGGDVTPTYGIVGMAGNLREWTRDEYRAYCSGCWATAPLEDPSCEGTGSSRRTVRGGDWGRGVDSLLGGLRDEGLEASAASPRVGFRCVRAGAGGEP